MNNQNKLKQRKFKRKYQIFAKELDGISLRNWKTYIFLDKENEDDFRNLNKLIESIEGGNIL